MGTTGAKTPLALTAIMKFSSNGGSRSSSGCDSTRMTMRLKTKSPKTARAFVF